MLHSPWWFLLLLILPVLGWRLLFTKRHGSAIEFSNTSFASEMTPTLRQRLLWLPKVLFLLALLFLVVSLARPREGREQTVTESEGIAIEMVVDRSGSMQALDFKIGGEHVDRLTAIKNVAAKFVMGDESLDGRFSDLIGLITFAGYADGVTPPTLDHGFLTSSLNQTEIVAARSEDGTAIGDAIALAVEKLNALDENRDDKVKSKIIILLTDGENTAGNLEPVAAAELAQTLGIKITEGKYFRAVDTDSLTEIYTEIDKLEKTKVETENFIDYSELAVQPYRDGAVSFWPTLMIAFSLLVTSVVLQNSWLRETS